MGEQLTDREKSHFHVYCDALLVSHKQAPIFIMPGEEALDDAAFGVSPLSIRCASFEDAVLESNIARRLPVCHRVISFVRKQFNTMDKRSDRGLQRRIQQPLVGYIPWCCKQ